LEYKDNLAINPVQSNLSILNNGGIRDMNVNKTISLLDALTGKFTPVLPANMISTTNDAYNMIYKGMVTMTPSYSPDGKSVLFSAAKAIESKNSLNSNAWLKEDHNIYLVNPGTKKVKKLTNKHTFDFAPKYILGGQEILFLRKTSEKQFSLFILKGNKEECIAKDVLNYEDNYFYGHIG
jgi:hypothetical protein